VKAHDAQPGGGFQDAVHAICGSTKDEKAELSVQVEQHRNAEYRDWHIVKNGANSFAHWPTIGT
jgi:hypothetical protein